MMGLEGSRMKMRSVRVLVNDYLFFFLFVD